MDATPASPPPLSSSARTYSGPWEFPRAAFVQHASDPVARYSHDLWRREPDWLRERVGADVSPQMKHAPLATHLQMIADLPVAGLAPAGHGHTYHRELMDAWIEVLGLSEPQALGPIPSGTWIDAQMKEQISQAIEEDLQRYHKGLGKPKD
mgnify:CR=1 FL=1